MKKTLLFLVAILAFNFAYATLFTISPSQTNVSCNGGNDGTASVVVIGGVGPFTYLWSPSGGTNSTATGLAAGLYTCVVTDMSDMSQASVMITIGQPATLLLPLTATPTSCNNTCDGTLIANPSGGTSPYSYLWTIVNATTQSISNLCVSTYTCTVVDANGCTVSNAAAVTQPPPVNVSVTPQYPSICSGDSATVTASGAVAYTWAPALLSGNPVIINPSSNTTYTVTGVDAMGCVGTQTFLVTVNNNPVILPGTIIPAGCNMSDGSADVSTSSILYTVMWNTIPAQTTLLASNLSSGNYDCLITDANGCSATLTVAVGDSCDYVWPGDANDDAVANNVDILDIGIANGATGTVRANASTNWIGQPSTAWGQTLMSGTDYKWVDCNGDGAINPTDTNAVVQNFGFTHNNRLGAAPVYNATLPDLSVVLNQSQIGAGSSATLNINLGSSAVPATNVYGLAFTLNFDGTQIDAATFHMNENGSWMGTAGNDLMGVVLRPATGSNSVQVALTRLDHNNANGFGNIANMAFTATNDLNGSGNTQNVLFSISNVTLISANETAMQANTVSDSITVMDPALLSAGANLNPETRFAVFPNPVNDNATVLVPEMYSATANEIVLTDASGRIIRSEKFSGTKFTFNCESVAAGMYFMSVYADGKCIGVNRIAIN